MPTPKLFNILTDIKDAKQMQHILNELLTPNELEDVLRRWQIMVELCEGSSQRDIAERHSMSLCKVTRGAKVLREKNSLCHRIIAGAQKGESS